MLSPVRTDVDLDNREMVRHGTIEFPAGFYHDDLLKESVPWHWHEELEAAVVTEGESLVTIGQASFTVSEGDGFFINSGVLHSCVASGTASCRFHSLVFHSRLIGGPDSVYYKKYVLPIIHHRGLTGIHLSKETAWQADALKRIEEAWQSAVGETEDYELKVREALSSLLSLVIRHLSPEELGQKAWAEKDEERIKRMLQFIGDEYTEAIRTEDIARSASVSESEALRCFKRTIGKTPIQFLREYRLDRASELLLSSSLSVSDIAYSTGFDDVSYFIKSFRHAKGCTPKAFRRENERSPT